MMHATVTQTRESLKTAFLSLMVISLCLGMGGNRPVYADEQPMDPTMDPNLLTMIPTTTEPSQETAEPIPGDSLVPESPLEKLRTEDTLNEDGLLIRRDFYNSEDILIQFMTYEYDEDGNLIRANLYDLSDEEAEADVEPVEETEPTTEGPMLIDGTLTIDEDGNQIIDGTVLLPDDTTENVEPIEDPELTTDINVGVYDPSAGTIVTIDPETEPTDDSNINIPEGADEALYDDALEDILEQDRDGDGVPDHLDYYPDDPTRSFYFTQEDPGGATIEINPVSDVDGDGMPDDGDPCPNNPDPMCGTDVA